MEVYRYRTGVVDTEQDLVTELDTFLTSYIGGWTRVETISDTASDRDYAWSSEGEDGRDTGVEGANPIVIRARGNSNYIYHWTYGTYVNSSTNTFEIYDATYTRTGSGSNAFRYWMFGNKSFVCYILEDTPGYNYMTYLGLIESFYIPETDPLPIANRSQYQASYGLTAGNTRCAMHSVTTSGLNWYEAIDWYTNFLQNDIGNRSNNLFMLPVLLRCDDASSSPDYEARGSFYGVYHANGTRLGNPGVVTTASGVFMAFKINNSNSYCNLYGPVASGIGSFPGLYINGTTGYSP